jgi:nucleotide-binding universal stress UspA family protein
MMVEQGIHKFADEIGADLVAIETHGRSGLSHFFRQSIAEDVANHSVRPVLSMRMERVKEKRGGIFPG